MALVIEKLLPTFKCAGSIAKFVMENEAGITYWIDRKFWGQGIATTALRDFLKIEQTRPIYGHVAFTIMDRKKF